MYYLKIQSDDIDGLKEKLISEAIKIGVYDDSIDTEKNRKSCPIDFSDVDYFCKLAITRAYQNLIKKKRPEISYRRADFHTICQAIADKVKAGMVDTKNPTFNKRIIEYAEINYIADTACKMLTLYFMLVNYLYLNNRKSEIMSLQKCITDVWRNRLTMKASSGEYSTTMINTGTFFDHFLGLKGYDIKTIEKPGSKLIDLAFENKKRVIHLRCYSDIEKGIGAHSISCMSIDSETIQVIDTTYNDVNYSRLRTEDLKDNLINNKEIKYADLIF